MFRTTLTGSIAATIAEVRDIPARVIPYAAAAALTRVAKAGQAAVVAELPRIFNSPTRYTLNAIRIEPAAKDKLSARVAVKDQAGGSNVKPESYLLPEAEGGERNEKRFEKALRYMGILTKGQRVMPGSAAKLDAAGNVSGATIRQILASLQGIRKGVGYAGQKARRGRALKNDLFVGVPQTGFGASRRNRAGALDGIWRREGKRLRPLFIFTSTVPQYGKRLDFDGIVMPIAKDRFRAEFERAALSIMSRRSPA